MYINQNDEGVSVSHSLIRRFRVPSFSLFLPPNHPSQKKIFSDVENPMLHKDHHALASVSSCVNRGHSQ